MRFRYEGFTKSGDVKRGYIDAEKIEHAAEELRMMGIFSQKLEPDGPAPMRQTLPGGAPLEPAPAKSTAWMDDRELKMTNPDVKQEASPEQVAKMNELVAQIAAAEAAILKKADKKPAPGDWQKELKDNLAIIGRVAKYCDKNDKLFADIPNPEFGKQLAVTEAVKQALMKAIHDAR